MKTYTIKAVTDCLSDNANKSIVNFKITKVEKVGFNEMEGSIYHVNIKLETSAGYRNKMIVFEINSTYLDEMDDDETIAEYLTDWFASFFF